MATAKFVRQIRREQKMSVAHLAERAGLHRNTVYRVETGLCVTLDNFEKLIDALGYEIELMRVKK